MSIRRLQSERGFTLVEAVLSVVIMSMALGACILSFSLASRVVGTGQYQMIAMHATRFQMERLRMYNYTNTVLSTGSHIFTNAQGNGIYTVTAVNSSTKNIQIDVPYLNRLRGGFLTNTLTTSIVTTLH